YGGKSSLLSHHFLHAHLLGFRHPITNEYLEFTSPLPEELQGVLRLLKQPGVKLGASSGVVKSTPGGRSL
ncbi:MAG: hypothetical protein O6914_03915, partial [Chloroflexi bacterium]|nr:hypothetical protein [Chloroflexota bacterium]